MYSQPTEEEEEEEEDGDGDTADIFLGDLVGVAWGFDGGSWLADDNSGAMCRVDADAAATAPARNSEGAWAR